MTLKNRLAWSGGAMASGFGKNIDPRNLRLCHRGATHVSLAGDWPGMAQALSGLGDVLASTLNHSAMLTQLGRFPAFELCPSGRFAVNEHGGLGFDFQEWRRLWATRRNTAHGDCLSLVLVGHDDAVAHQILLAGATNDEALAQFARRFQGEPETHRRRPVRGARECEGHHERFQRRKWEFVESPESHARRLDTSVVTALLEAVIERRLCLSTTIVSAPVIQSAIWKPELLERREEQLNLSNPSTQLCLRLSAVEEIWAVPLPAESGRSYAVELYDDHDRLLIGFSARPGSEDAWEEIISSL